MLQIFKIILIGYLFLTNPAVAQVVESTVSAQGSGVTRDAAIANALASAAGQAFGVTIDASSVASSTSIEQSNDAGSTSAMTSQLNQAVAQKINIPGNQPILGYTIDRAEKTGGDTWDASVTLKYAKFQKMGADSNRRSVVVVTNDKRYKDLLITTVGDSLVGSRRFDVMNRDNSALFDQEKAFVTGADAGAAEVARLGQATGADYLVIAELQGVTIANDQRETIKMTGEVLVRSSVSGMLKLQVVEFASRKVKWSSTEKFGGNYAGTSSISNQTMITLVSGAAEKLVEKLVANIYPIRVAKVVSANTAVVNRGEDSIKKGESFSIYLVGEELKDPQSGESLGPMEIEVGVGKIVDVKPKFSYIQLATGTLDPKAEYILRKTSPVAATPSVAKSAPGNVGSGGNAPVNAKKNLFMN